MFNTLNAYDIMYIKCFSFYRVLYDINHIKCTQTKKNAWHQHVDMCKMSLVLKALTQTIIKI